MGLSVGLLSRGVIALALIVGVLVAPGAGTARAPETLPGARLVRSPETGAVGFMTTARGRPIARPSDVAPDAAPATAARAFLDRHGSLFGVADQSRDLRTERTRTEQRGGRSFVRFQQVDGGVPVLGGELVVELDGARNTVATTGEIVPDVNLDLDPAVSAQSARDAALTLTSKGYRTPVSGLRASTPELSIYDSSLLGAPGPSATTLVWRVDVTSVRLRPLDEVVLVDAKLGSVALQFSQVEAARNRSTYTAANGSTLPGTLKCTEASIFPACATGDADVEAAHRNAGLVYDFYASRHGRDSVDGKGEPLISTAHYGHAYDNVFWDPDDEQMVIGDARTFAQADDVIGHELTHAVTQHESGLFYYAQSGAINESLSDVFGEFIDLTDGTGNDAPSVRWLLGEDVSPGGAVRSMINPPAFGQPDRMTSAAYASDESDSAGVHTNSGVGNKAAYLMTDGGTFNGQTVTGLGIDKAEAIYYEAATNLLTSASDYQDLYNALQQACANLVGTHGIVVADCQQVKNALDAVEMNVPPPAAPTKEAPVCAAGTQNDLFADDLENPSSLNWLTGSNLGPVRFFYPQNPNFTQSDMTYATSGVTNIYAYDTNIPDDSTIATTRPITLPEASYLRFNHAYVFEHFDTDYYDGGVVEYTTNNGATWTDAGPLFTHGGYDGPLQSGTGSPLAGRQAFGGQSYGYGASRLDLTSLAGKSVRFRFRLATDSGGNDPGWFIDDVRVFQCVPIGAPGAPTNVRAVSGDGEATVTFVPPASIGGAPITSYTVRATPGGASATSVGGLVLPVYGLTNGVTYTFAVTAANALGESAVSAASAAVTPVDDGGRPAPAPPASQPRPVVPDPPAPVTRVPVPPH